MMITQRQKYFIQLFQTRSYLMTSLQNKFTSSEMEWLNKLAKRFRSKSNRFFIALEFAIYEGAFKIAQADCFPIIPFKKKMKDLELKIKFLNTTQDKNELYYYQIRKNARLSLNVWWIDLKKRCFWLGSAGMNLFTEKGFLKQKQYDIHLWPLQKFIEDLNCYGTNKIGPKKTRPWVTIKLKNHENAIKAVKDNLKEENKAINISKEENESNQRHLEAIKENQEKRLNYYEKCHEVNEDAEASFLPMLMKSDIYDNGDYENTEWDQNENDPNTAHGVLEKNSINLKNKARILFLYCFIVI